MKKIVSGTPYDTETATALGSAKLPGFRRAADGTENRDLRVDRAGTSTLYQTSSGAYFLVRRIKADASADPDVIGEGLAIGEPGLYPLSREEALRWARFWQFSDKKIEVMFEQPV
jgi:hypothetical protein